MRILALPLVIGIAFTAGVASAMASVVGTNPPSQPLTAERIAALPTGQQAAWKEYLERSKRQMQADKDSLRAERKAAGTTNFPVPAAGRDARSVPLDKDAGWYATADATHSLQTSFYRSRRRPEAGAKIWI